MSVAQLMLVDFKVAAKEAKLPPIIKVDEAALFARVTPKTIRRWIQSGRLHAAKTDPRKTGLVRISLDHFLQVLCGSQ